MLNYNKNLKEYSRRLRKEMTDAERQLWARIRGKQLKNPPQSPFFKGGSYSFLKRGIHRKVGRTLKIYVRCCEKTLNHAKVLEQCLTYIKSLNLG